MSEDGGLTDESWTDSDSEWEDGLPAFRGLTVDRGLRRSRVVVKESFPLFGLNDVFVCKRDLLFPHGTALGFSRFCSFPGSLNRACLVFAGVGGTVEGICINGRRRCPVEIASGTWTFKRCKFAAPTGATEPDRRACSTWSSVVINGGCVTFQECTFQGGVDHLGVIDVYNKDARVVMWKCVVDQSRFVAIGMTGGCRLSLISCEFKFHRGAVIRLSDRQDVDVLVVGCTFVDTGFAFELGNPSIHTLSGYCKCFCRYNPRKHSLEDNMNEPPRIVDFANIDKDGNPVVVWNDFAVDAFRGARTFQFALAWLTRLDRAVLHELVSQALLQSDSKWRNASALVEETAHQGGQVLHQHDQDPATSSAETSADLVRRTSS